MRIWTTARDRAASSRCPTRASAPLATRSLLGARTCGTATEVGGGRVAAVEVSTDNGATSHRATGTSSCTDSWTPTSSGPTTLKSRAADDSANIETPGAGFNVTVSSTNTLVAAYGFNEG